MLRPTPRTCSTLIAIVLAALAVAPVWAQTGLLRAKVVDADKKPLQGVQITVTSEQLGSYRKNIVTGKKGDFSLRFQPNQLQYEFVFLFEKPGYQSFTVPISPSAQNEMRQQWVMEEAETQVVQSHGDLGAVVSGSSNVAVTAFNDGLTAQREGNLDVARAKYEAALAEDADLSPAQVALSQVLLDQGDYDAALAAADRALGMPINRADALRVKYQALKALGRSGEADAIAGELEAADGASATARVRYNEGGEAFQAGDRDTALAKFVEAAELDPSLIDAHHAIATIRLAKGEYGGSAEAAEKALSLGSEDIRTLRVLYDAYDALGKTEELTEIAPRLAAVDPDFGGSKLVEQAAALWNNGQAEKAVQLSKLALSMDPNLAKAYYFVGLDHVSGGRSDEARAALEKFIELAPDDPEVATAREMMSYLD